MKKLFYHIALVFFISNWSFAQTTFVPDTNLRRVLVTFWPSYMDQNGYVVDAKAANYTSYLNLSGQNIKDVTGIWKFTSLTSLVCQENAISSLDSLSKMPNLSSLYCYRNKLTTLPDLSKLTKLSYLSCGINQFTSLPDLSNNVPLTYLDCGKNLISSLKGIDKLVNLQTLSIYSNNLDSIPDLSKLSKLQVLSCQGNNLSELPGLSKLTQLSQLSGGNNKFDSLPDLSGLTKLTVFRFYNCQLNSIPSLSNMKGLTEVLLSNNKLKIIPDFSGNTSLSQLEFDHNLLAKLPDFSASKSALNILKLHNNQLDSLPDFSLFTTLDTVYVQNNRLTFEDVIPLAQKTSIVNVKYTPQDSIGISKSLFITENQAFRMVIGIDKKVAGNQYTWYKNDKFYATTNSDTLLISKTQLADSGVYSCQVNNMLAPLLTLNIRSFTLKVTPCIDLSKMTYSTADIDCNFGGKLNISEASIVGGQKPYSYRLVGNETGTIRQVSTSLMSDLFENAYTLEISDQKGCKSIYRNIIALKGKRGIDCKRLVILGNDNSPNNTLFLEEKGSAKVYDEEGQLVQSFSTPSTWDGKNKNGEFLPGYYIIDLNGKMLNVTLIK